MSTKYDQWWMVTKHATKFEQSLWNSYPGIMSSQTLVSLCPLLHCTWGQTEWNCFVLDWHDWEEEMTLIKLYTYVLSYCRTCYFDNEIGLINTAYAFALIAMFLAKKKQLN